jgi:hypothetical protein
MFGLGRRAAMAAVLATLLMSPSPGVAAGPAPADESTTTVAARIGSYNIRVDRTLAQVREAVGAFKPKVDVAGLQEIGGHKKANILREDPEWGIYQAPHLLQIPIIWRLSAFEIIRGREYLLARGRRIEDGSGGLKFKRTTYAAVARLRHVATGELISAVNVHLVPGAIMGGRRAPGRRRAYGYYTDQMTRLRSLTARERDLGYTTYVVGDFNAGYAADERERVRALPFRRFRSLGFSSVWRGRELDPRGTHIDTSCRPGVRYCGAYIDGVWSDERSADARVLTGIKMSDHYPVVATYELPVPPG